MYMYTLLHIIVFTVVYNDIGADKTLYAEMVWQGHVGIKCLIAAYSLFVNVVAFTHILGNRQQALGYMITWSP